MKQSFSSKIRLVAAAAILSAGSGVIHADVLFSEDFNYPVGTEITAKGWVTH